MHPVLAMREWKHAHHGEWGHHLALWVSKEMHDYHLWVALALILYLAAVIGLVLLAGGDNPPMTMNPLYPFYQF